LQIKPDNIVADKLSQGEVLAGLFLVPTPVGNLADFTFRAVDILKRVDVVLCEDTRTSSFLLNHYQVSKPLTPYHQHNEHKILQHLVDQLLAGKTMGLVTDAGTPGISDPAFLLVRECIKNDIRVECLPGATALYLLWSIVASRPTGLFSKGFLH
jgi:16S rRNA (cytidine1402-2'-O)-methyltransferase